LAQVHSKPLTNAISENLAGRFRFLNRYIASYFIKSGAAVLVTLRLESKLENSHLITIFKN
jgi:hypothetical protein